jgi:Bacterial mobilisation protein (MobC)
VGHESTAEESTREQPGPVKVRRVPGRRPIKVMVTEAEHAELTRRAGAIGQRGISVQRLLLEAALAGDGSPSSRGAVTASQWRALVTELLGVRRLVAALGNNVNQLAARANATGQAPPELGPAAEAVSRTLDRLDQAVAAFTTLRRR